MRKTHALGIIFVLSTAQVFDRFPRLRLRFPHAASWNKTTHCPKGGDTAVAAAAARSENLANEPDAVLVQGGFERRRGDHLVHLEEDPVSKMPGAEAAGAPRHCALAKSAGPSARPPPPCHSVSHELTSQGPHQGSRRHHPSAQPPSHSQLQRHDSPSIAKTGRNKFEPNNCGAYHHVTWVILFVMTKTTRDRRLCEYRIN